VAYVAEQQHEIAENNRKARAEARRQADVFGFDAHGSADDAEGDA
jgi:hypothetical protein